RGAVDDKSGSFASLLALAAINDLLAEGALELPRRVRVIFGGDEESGMTCAQHYAATQPATVFAVSPDGEWPVVFAEKGQALVDLAGPCPEAGELYAAEITCGTRRNVVPALAEAKLLGSAAGLAGGAEALAGWWDRNVTFERSAEGIELRATGKAAHGSTPFMGDNAGIRLLRVLAGLPVAGRDRWSELLALCDPAGEGLGLAGADPVSGPTTSNLGTIEVGSGRVSLGLDVRFRSDRDLAWVREQVAAAAPKAGLSVVEVDGIPPMHEPVDGTLVQTVMAVYRAELNGENPPIARGARTYASYIPHCVCVGRDDPSWSEGGVHGADEHYALPALRTAGRALAHLLIRLAMAPAD
ncbi:hypothetical protein LCGC14_1600660, partial [marine sediment metagenome]